MITQEGEGRREEEGGWREKVTQSHLTCTQATRTPTSATEGEQWGEVQDTNFQQSNVPSILTIFSNNCITTVFTIRNCFFPSKPYKPFAYYLISNYVTKHKQKTSSERPSFDETPQNYFRPIVGVTTCWRVLVPYASQPNST